MALPSRFQRYDSLIDLLVEQAVCDVMEARRPADAGEATRNPAEKPSSERGQRPRGQRSSAATAP